MKPQKALTLLMFFVALCFFLAFLIGTQENTAYLLIGGFWACAGGVNLFRLNKRGE